MKHGSLFSGIGGFDLASEWMGWENVFHCEWNEFGKKVLKHYWPNAESFDDITKTDFTKYANKIDILTGGFPCQPYSSAGQRKGKEDERHLWPEMLRAIREIKPKYIVGENVFGLLNWNGGMVFDEVHTDLEFEGYEVQAVVIPAAAVNAPHGRDRVWFVAYNHNHGLYGPKDGQGVGQRNERDTKGTEQTRKSSRCANEDAIFATNTNSNERCNLCGQKPSEWIDSKAHTRATNDGSNGIVANTCDTGLQGGELNGTFEGGERKCNDARKSITELYQIENWQQFPTQSPICGGDDGLPTKLDGITFSKWRNESIKAYGNAIVPQVAYEIFKAIQATNENMD
jgi:DNA (cytosine-5)-methyltransferase 1